MPKQRMIVAVGVALVWSLPAGAGQAPMTEQEYGAAMTEINFLVGDAELHIDSRYWPELADDVRKLRAQFERVETFWTARETGEAATLARQAIEGLSPIAEAGAAKDAQAASAALRALRGTCDSCHEAHREPGPDGYQIKQ